MILKQNSRSFGQEIESLACRYLQTHGLKLIERNFHGRYGELDLIMADSSSVVFIEVRYRHNENFGTAAETVTRTKQKKLIMTAMHYLQINTRYADRPCRFDVVSISGAGRQQDINWIKDAFQVVI